MRERNPDLPDELREVVKKVNKCRKERVLLLCRDCTEVLRCPLVDDLRQLTYKYSTQLIR